MSWNSCIVTDPPQSRAHATISSLITSPLDEMPARPFQEDMLNLLWSANRTLFHHCKVLLFLVLPIFQSTTHLRCLVKCYTNNSKLFQISGHFSKIQLLFVLSLHVYLYSNIHTCTSPPYFGECGTNERTMHDIIVTKDLRVYLFFMLFYAI